MHHNAENSHFEPFKGQIDVKVLAQGNNGAANIVNKYNQTIYS